MGVARELPQQLQAVYHGVDPLTQRLELLGVEEHERNEFTLKQDNTSYITVQRQTGPIISIRY